MKAIKESIAKIDKILTKFLLHLIFFLLQFFSTIKLLYTKNPTFKQAHSKFNRLCYIKAIIAIDPTATTML